MRTQWISPQLGTTGIMRAVPPYDSPIPPGSRVTVIEKADGVPQVRVRDDQGSEWTIGHWQVDCGTLYEVEPGRWRPERDPEVLDHLQSLYVGSVANLGQPGASDCTKSLSKG
jgi:hypothetical protein